VIKIKPEVTLAFIRRTAPFAEVQTNQLIAAQKEAELREA
jgi:hypothetical protein